jgi:hypothetical protein
MGKIMHRRSLCFAALVLLASSIAAARPGATPNRSSSASVFTLSLGAGAPTADRNIIAAGMTKPGFIFLTHVWNHPVTQLSAPVPAGSTDGRLDTGVYFDKPVVVQWNPNASAYRLSSADASVIPTDVAFNVHYEPAASQLALVHRSTVDNTLGTATVIDHALTNDKPGAILQVTTEGGASTNRKVIGVFYTLNRWAIFNQDRSAVPADVRFHVLVSDTAATRVVGRKSVVTGNSLYLEDLPAAVRGNPKARLLVTPVYAPQTAYNNHVVGVWFDRARGMWAIFNEDRAPMPENAAFNVDWDAGTVAAR